MDASGNCRTQRSQNETTQNDAETATPRQLVFCVPLRPFSFCDLCVLPLSGGPPIRFEGGQLCSSFCTEMMPITMPNAKARQSLRSATIGSTRAARRAGTYTAIAPTAMSTTGTVASTVRSVERVS